MIELSTAPDPRPRHHYSNFARIPVSLQSSRNPYLSSLVYQNNFGAASPPRQPSLGRSPSVLEPLKMYDTPYHTVQLADARLDEAQPSTWTNVKMDDGFLRGLLSNYFVFEYPFFPYFHKDYFLKDMANGRHRFCSPLLVNAVLAAACVSHQPI
jgi:hypothetical protein